MTTYERAWIAALLETGSIHHESRGGGRRRATVEISNRNAELMERAALILGATPPRRREQEPKAGVDWREPIYRVRLRGARAAALLEELLDDFTGPTRERAEATLLEVR